MIFFDSRMMTVEVRTGMERFLSRGQKPCKYTGTNENVNIGEEIDLVHHHGS